MLSTRSRQEQPESANCIDICLERIPDRVPQQTCRGTPQDISSSPTHRAYIIASKAEAASISQCLRAYHPPADRCLHSLSFRAARTASSSLQRGQLRYRPSPSHIYSAVKFGSDSALVSAVDTRAPRLHVRIDTSESTGGKARNRCGFVARPSSPQAYFCPPPAQLVCWLTCLPFESQIHDPSRPPDPANSFPSCLRSLLLHHTPVSAPTYWSLCCEETLRVSLRTPTRLNTTTSKVPSS